MGIFKRRREKRSYTSGEITADVELDLLLRGALIDGQVTKQNVMSIPSINAGINLVSNIIASLPIKLYKEKDGATEEQNDARVSLLNDDTKDIFNGFNLKKNLVTDYYYNGAGYAFINKYLNEVKSLHYLRPDIVNPQYGIDEVFKTAYFLVNERTFYEHELIKILKSTKDGVNGTGIVQELNLMFSTVFNSLKYENVLVRKGGNKRGFIEAERKITKEAMDAIRLAWKNLYENNSENVVVLNDGAKFKEASNTAVEMQLSENKLVNNSLAYQILGINPNVLNGNCTIEQFRNFITMCIIPILKLIETELNKTMLLESEKGSFYFAFDTKELLKGDILTRYQAYKLAIEGGFMQSDEVRYMEDLEPLKLGFIKLNQTDVLLNPKTGDIYNCNANSMQNINKANANLEGGAKIES